MEQIILSANMEHLKGNQVIRPSQHGFMKGGSYLMHLVSYNVICLVDESEAVDVVWRKGGLETLSCSTVTLKEAVVR